MLRIIILIVTILFTAPSFAGPLLMIVKVKDNVTDYGPKLTATIKSQLATTPSASFDVITMVPKSGKRRFDKHVKKNSTSLTGAVIGVLVASGVDSAKIASSIKNVVEAGQTEVHVFAK